MKKRSPRLLGVLLVCVAVSACPRDGSTPSLTLAGDVPCPAPPPTVTGTATLNAAGTGITVAANVMCNGIPVQGVVLNGEIRHPARTLSYTFPPTDAAGNTSLTESFPPQILPSAGSQFRIRVMDGRGRPVAPPDPVEIAIQ